MANEHLNKTSRDKTCGGINILDLIALYLQGMKDNTKKENVSGHVVYFVD